MLSGMCYFKSLLTVFNVLLYLNQNGAIRVSKPIIKPFFQLVQNSIQLSIMVVKD